MKINYIKTIGFRKFKDEFETEIYDITKIIGRNYSGKSNILYAIINILLGTSLSGDEKTCLINNNSDASYGELHFTDNDNIRHVLIRGKHKYNNNNNFITLDGKNISQKDLLKFYKDKKLFLSIINPNYFLSKKPSEQKELIDKYLSDIKPKVIFDTLTSDIQDSIIEKYFSIKIKEIYHKLDLETLTEIYNEYNLQNITGKDFLEIPDKDKWETICSNIKNVKGLKYFNMLSPTEQEDYINQNMLDLCMYIAFDQLDNEEQNLLEGIPQDIPTYIKDINSNIKRHESIIAALDGKIEYAKNIVNEDVPQRKVFEKEEELLLAKQELNHLNTNKDVIDKDNQREIVEKIEKEVLSKETEVTDIEHTMKTGKQKYLTLKNSSSPICPTCEQQIKGDNKLKAINNMRNELISVYDRYNILKTELLDKKFNLSVERCKFHALEGSSTLEKCKRISVVEKDIKQLEDSKLEIEKWNNEITIKENNIKKAKSDIDNFEKEKQINNNCIDSLNKAKKVAQKLYISYIEEKLRLAKKYLKDVDIKFYSVLKTTGEITDDFRITYKDRDLSDLSKSEKVATSIEFSNMFNKITNSHFPIFIDDNESCADFDFINTYGKDNQLIISQVVKGSPLKITNLSQKGNRAITGVKTISINNNHTNTIPKVA